MWKRRPLTVLHRTLLPSVHVELCNACSADHKQSLEMRFARRFWSGLVPMELKGYVDYYRFPERRSGIVDYSLILTRIGAKICRSPKSSKLYSAGSQTPSL